MKGVTLGSLFLLSLAGGALFHVKYQVALIADQLKAVLRQKEDVTQAMHLLQAEWAYLNEPARLEVLAQKYLALGPSAPHQILSAIDLGDEPQREDT